MSWEDDNSAWNVPGMSLELFARFRSHSYSISISEGVDGCQIRRHNCTLLQRARNSAGSDMKHEITR